MDFPDDPQLALDLGEIEVDTRVVTLVLAHSASEEPLETELFLGRPRFNADRGSPWWWRIAVSRESLGDDPRVALAEPTLPIWDDEEADVPLRLRDPASDLHHETA
jgi:hypothetical protein